MIFLNFRISQDSAATYHGCGDCPCFLPVKNCVKSAPRLSGTKMIFSGEDSLPSTTQAGVHPPPPHPTPSTPRPLLKPGTHWQQSWIQHGQLFSKSTVAVYTFNCCWRGRFCCKSVPGQSDTVDFQVFNKVDRVEFNFVASVYRALLKS